MLAGAAAGGTRGYCSCVSAVAAAAAEGRPAPAATVEDKGAAKVVDALGEKKPPGDATKLMGLMPGWPAAAAAEAEAVAAAAFEAAAEAAAAAAAAEEEGA